MTMKNASANSLPRITITLGEGQREALQAIADRNHTTLSFVVRHALDRFIEEHRHKQLRLDL